MATRKSSRRAVHKLVWTERALRDLEAIDAYIAADDPEAATQWIAKILAKAERAAKLPLSGQVVRERGRSDLRQVLIRTYRVVYRIRESQVDVITVFEGHQQLPEDVE